MHALHLSQYYSFLFAYILATHLKKSVHALNMNMNLMFYGRLEKVDIFVTNKWGTICSRGRPWVVTMDGPGGGPSVAPWTVRSDRL